MMARFGGPSSYPEGNTVIPAVILTEQDLQNAVEYILTKEAFAFDVEAQGENRGMPNLANLSWISLATDGFACVIPFGHPIGDNIIGTDKVLATYESGKKIGQTYRKSVPVYDAPPAQLDRGTVFRILTPLFRSNLVKIGHDVIYDLVSCSLYLGFLPPGPYRCTKTGQWLLNENRMRWGLKDITEEKYGFKYDFENIGACVEKHPFSLVAYYSYCDAKYAWFLDKDTYPLIVAEGLEEVYKLEMDILKVMCEMRITGARVDLERLEELHVDLTAKLKDAEADVYLKAGRKFNINSPLQRQQILFGPKPDGQGLKPFKLTDGGKKHQQSGGNLTIRDYSTDDSVLEMFEGNPVCAAMREYGDIGKLLNTYVDSYLGYGKSDKLVFNERIHAGFQQYGTVTGRFSCKKPNLQNIPRPSTELGNLIRGIFIADDDCQLVVADYEQIELVVLAHYIGHGGLFDAFMNGIDPHSVTAAMVTDQNPVEFAARVRAGDKEAKVIRQDLGKTLGFAVVYGAGLNKVASMAKVDVRAAKALLKKHAQMFPEVHLFKQQVIDKARSRKVPYITTLSGRKRRVPALRSLNEGHRMGAERQIFNSLIQGGAADILKYAMVRVDRMLPPEIRLSLTVHDELVLISPVDRVQEAKDILTEAMTGQDLVDKLGLRVPLKIDVNAATRWSEAK